MSKMNWQHLVLKDYANSPESIGRAVARELEVPWATMWDFKQRVISGEVTYDSLLTKPKILLFDIESAPLLVHNWSLWQNFTSLNQIMEDWYMLSWSAKWLGEDDTMYDGLNEHEAEFAKDPSNDYHITKSLFDLINEADIVIGHNMKKFDNKKVKARLLKHGFVMPEPYRVIDTLDIAKREFSLTSNKLDFIATYLGLENKVSHEGHSLWTKCMAGDPEAWKVMKEYNIYDTVLLEDVYLELRGWYTAHPNLAVYYNDYKTRCPTCGSDEIKLLDNTAKTNLSEFETYRCGGCGKVSRGGTNLLTKKKRKSLLRNI